MKPLLLFRLYTIGENAYWDARKRVALPEGCSAIAVTGGMDDIWERRKGKLSEPDEKGISYPLPPFLRCAHGWITTRLVWLLLGPGGRFYPIYRRGFSVLTSPKFQSQKSALDVDWSGDFMTCHSEAIGLGFCGETNKLERKLAKAETFAQYRKIGETKLESTRQKMEEVHPFLQANWDENGFEWFLQNAALIMRPEGWEGEDAIFLSSRMSHDEMIKAIHSGMGSEFEVIDYDGDEMYRKWSSWPWPLQKDKRDDPWFTATNSLPPC